MRRRRFASHDLSSEEPFLNLTPLIDVVFVVLIAFILIAPMLEIDHVELAKNEIEKKKESVSAPEVSPLTILVKKDNTLWIQGKKFALPEIEKELLLRKKLYPTKHPQVIHDKEAAFGTYQSVKNMLERCGFDQMEVVLKPK